MSRHGYDALSIDALAAAVHCSPATTYRHVGGKSAIRDAVMSRQAERILDSVREAITGLSGTERIITTTVALQRIRADPLVQVLRSTSGPPSNEWLTDSPIVARLASEMIGLDLPDPLAAQWLVRVFLALLYSRPNGSARMYPNPTRMAFTIRSVPLRFAIASLTVEELNFMNDQAIYRVEAMPLTWSAAHA